MKKLFYNKGAIKEIKNKVITVVANHLRISPRYIKKRLELFTTKTSVDELDVLEIVNALEVTFPGFKMDNICKSNYYQLTINKIVKAIIGETPSISQVARKEKPAVQYVYNRIRDSVINFCKNKLCIESPETKINNAEVDLCQHCGFDSLDVTDLEIHIEKQFNIKLDDLDSPRNSLKLADFVNLVIDAIVGYQPDTVKAAIK